MDGAQKPVLSDEPAKNDVLEILAEVPDELLVEVLESRGNAQIVISKQFSASHQSFSGPLPPPQVLAAYNELSPGLLDRIVTMAEKEQQHRHSTETEIVKGKFAVDTRGQHYALSASCLLIALAAGALYQGHPGTAATIAVTAVVGTIGAFLRNPVGNKRQNVADTESPNSHPS